MKRLGLVLGLLAAATSPALAAAPSRDLTIITSEDAKVCAHFRTDMSAAPINWQHLPPSPDAENFRAVFDFENSGKPVEVRWREDSSAAFGGSYFLTAPQGFKVPEDWFDASFDPNTGLPAPPAPMRIYVQADMNTSGEIARFNNKTYLRTTPLIAKVSLIMILEPKAGKLREICRYQLNK